MLRMLIVIGLQGETNMGDLEREFMEMEFGISVIVESKDSVDYINRVQYIMNKLSEES